MAEAGVFRTDEMLRLANEHWSGASDHNYRLWMLFNVEMFWRHFIDGVAIEQLEEWIASSMPAESVSKLVEPAAESAGKASVKLHASA